MNTILIHGLGQNESSWKVVKNELKNRNIEAKTPNLYYMLKGKELDYVTLFEEFCDYCNAFDWHSI